MPLDNALPCCTRCSMQHSRFQLGILQALLAVGPAYGPARRYSLLHAATHLFADILHELSVHARPDLVELAQHRVLRDVCAAETYHLQTGWLMCRACQLSAQSCAAVTSRTVPTMLRTTPNLHRRSQDGATRTAVALNLARLSIALRLLPRGSRHRCVSQSGLGTGSPNRVGDPELQQPVMVRARTGVVPRINNRIRMMVEVRVRVEVKVGVGVRAHQ